jgi:hypothetical protein
MAPAYPNPVLKTAPRRGRDGTSRASIIEAIISTSATIPDAGGSARSNRPATPEVGTGNGPPSRATARRSGRSALALSVAAQVLKSPLSSLVQCWQGHLVLFGRYSVFLPQN